MCVFVLGLKDPASKAVHEETNRRVEKISRILHVATGVVCPQFVVWPKFLGCFAIYFTTDVGSEAFELPFPMWYAYFWNADLITNRMFLIAAFS